MVDSVPVAGHRADTAGWAEYIQRALQTQLSAALDVSSQPRLRRRRRPASIQPLSGSSVHSLRTLPAFC